MEYVARVRGLFGRPKYVPIVPPWKKLGEGKFQCKTPTFTAVVADKVFREARRNSPEKKVVITDAC